MAFESATSGTGYVRALPKTLTTEMMEEVLFRICDLAPSTHVTIGYVPPDFVPYYNTVVPTLCSRISRSPRWVMRLVSPSMTRSTPWRSQMR